ncbi:NAD(P)-dependent oxidoreductase [Salinibacter sp. 10B]|uniref:SDR family oxidoreductase n=1 Tax=Salinibacter sp. 10B TaxID=1923971 RepID=UPI000CF41A37|nr:SDR family oxidoreductase [Salinibacter sp. 10B]PQJ33324.1 NAD(P)-dependent oxidoreductase [Salinibacter sp. 10B]
MAQSSPTTVLVTGATGYVGGRLVPCLLREGYTVRCFVRNADRLRAQPWGTDVEVVEGDALQAETVPPAMQNVSVVYYLIHSLGSGEDTFAERDRRAATNIRTAAEDAGVDRLIYLGGMRPKGSRQSKHLQSRIETGDVLRDGPIPVTEFRAAQIVGSGSLSFELVRYLTERVPLMICPKWVHTPTQPIAIRNVLQYLIAALDQPESAGEIVEIGGRDVLTYRDMFQIYAAVRGLRRWIVNVPFLTPRLSSHWVGLVTPVPNSIARPLIEGLDNEVVVDDPEEARRLFPSVEPMAFEAAVRLALRRVESDELPTVWNSAVSSTPRSPSRTTTLDTTEGLYREVRTTAVDVPPETAFDTIRRLGGETGWLYGDALWHLRGWIDQLMGGVGFRKGRRHETRLRVGDAVDFWRVEALEPGRLLRLRAEMQMPGRAWLQFDVTPASDEHARTQVTQTVFFEPKGLMGALYWNAVRPVHGLLFAGQLRALEARMKQESQTEREEPPAPETTVAERRE